MTITGLLIVCTIVILLAIWLGYWLLKSSIQDKMEIETTALGHAIEKKLNALDELQENRLNKETFQLNEKIDNLVERIESQHFEILKSNKIHGNK